MDNGWINHGGAEARSLVDRKAASIFSVSCPVEHSEAAITGAAFYIQDKTCQLYGWPLFFQSSLQRMWSHAFCTSYWLSKANRIDGRLLRVRWLLMLFNSYLLLYQRRGIYGERERERRDLLPDPLLIFDAIQQRIRSG